MYGNLEGYEVNYEPVIEGLFGRAERIDFAKNPLSAATLDIWLITAPQYHPLWSQYGLMVVSLDESIPGFPPTLLHFTGATHEMLVVAINPDAEGAPFTAESLNERLNNLRGVPHLTPVNHCHQFKASDEEILKLAWQACYGVVNGVLNPETGDAPTKIRQAWKSVLDETLVDIQEGRDS